MRSLHLVNGQPAKAVVVAPRGNPKGIQIVVADADGQPKAIQFSQTLESIPPDVVINLLCFQERVFGDGRLPAVEG